MTPPASSTEASRYPPVLQFLHWAIALSVTLQVFLIVVLRQLQSLEFGQVVLAAHRECGVVVWLLVVTRLILSKVYRRPAQIATTPLWQRMATRMTHGAILLLLVAQPILGVLQAWGRGNTVWLLGFMSTPELTTQQGLMFGGLHRWTAYGLMALIALHLAAVIFNRVVGKASVTGRMLPAMSPDRFVNRVPVSAQLALVWAAILSLSVAAGLYGANQFSDFNRLQGRFAQVALTDLGVLRDAQLAVLSMQLRKGPPGDDARGAEQITATLRGILGDLGDSDAKAAAQDAVLILNHVPEDRSALTRAAARLQSAIESQSATVFQTRASLEEVGAKGRDMIILTLAPSVLLAAVMSALLARSIMTDLAHARLLVRSVTESADLGAIDVVGDGDFALLMREILEMRAAVAAREQADAARQGEAEAEARKEAAARRHAEEISRAKSEFLTNMSHEIRTPLNGVLGMAQAMARDALPPEQADRLAIIRSSGENLLSLLNALLDISKIEAGMMELESIEFDLAATLQDACAGYQGASLPNGLTFTLSLASDLGECRGDPNRLRQVIANLASNAVKFTATGAVDVAAIRMGDDVRFTVSDTGLGMPPETLDTIFDKFVQADASTTRRFGGTGLGLTICRDLVAMMGGRIAVQSELGKGSRFEFTLALPLLRAARTSAPQVAAAANDTSRLRVLAAEDNEVNQMVLRALLEPAGLNLTIVDNGAEAVAAWKRETWDAILMDIQMPVMDGRDATRAIRGLEASSARARTPIIALTANVMTHQAAEYLAVGMDAVVPKPLKVEELYSALEAVLVAAPEVRAGAAWA